MANEKLLTTLLQQYQTLSAEFRTLLVIGFVLATMIGAGVVTALMLAYVLERQEILLILPAATIGPAVALIEVRNRYLSLAACLGMVEGRINAILGQPQMLGWYTRAKPSPTPSGSAAGTLQHDLGIGFSATALFLLMLALGARYIAEFDYATWKLTLYIGAYALSFLVLWCSQVLYRFFLVNPQQLGEGEKAPERDPVDNRASTELRE